MHDSLMGKMRLPFIDSDMLFKSKEGLTVSYFLLIITCKLSHCTNDSY